MLHFDTVVSTIQKWDKQVHFKSLTFLRLFEAMSWNKAQAYGLHYTLTYF